MPTKARHLPRKKTTSPGLALEKTVARLQQMLDPLSTVTHNEWLKDRIGNRRQFDVVIRGKFGGRDVVGIVECKDHSRRKGPDAIEAFAKKCENLGANLRIVVSRKGFTPQALAVARHEGIGCLSLLPDAADAVGFAIGDYWFGLVKTWTNLRIGFKPLPSPDYLQGVAGNAIQVDGKEVQRWFYRELVTKHQDQLLNQDYTLAVKFDPPRKLQCSGETLLVDEVFCIAQREIVKKRKWVSWNGDALYDWHHGTFTVPNQGVLRGSAVETDLNLWTDYAGLLPSEMSEEKPIGFIAVALIKQQGWDETEDKFVPQLTDGALYLPD